MAEETQNHNTADAAPVAGNEAEPVSKKPLSTFQRVLEHGLSFTILVPAIASFFIFLLAILSLSAQIGAWDGITSAFALSGKFITVSYVFGFFPSAITGFLTYPFWQAVNGGKKAWACIALFNGALIGLTGLFLMRMDAFENTVSAVVGVAATLASLFLTRKLRLP